MKKLYVPYWIIILNFLTTIYRLSQIINSIVIEKTDIFI